jgi:hypothetical protein
MPTEAAKASMCIVGTIRWSVKGVDAGIRAPRGK